MLPCESSFPQFSSFNESKEQPQVSGLDRGLLVHMEEIDTLHGEFIDLLNALHSSSDETFPAIFQALVTHTEGHFDFENRQMRRKRYPLSTTHRAEHDRVLSEMREVNSEVQQGRLKRAKYYLSDLPAWFRLHVLSMDCALSNFLTK